MWIDDFITHRRAQKTNSYLVSHIDRKREADFIALVNSGMLNEFIVTETKKGWSQRLLWDLQLGSLSNLKDGSNVPWDTSMMPHMVLDQLLKQEPTLLLITYAFTKELADALANPLMSWSLDNQLFRQQSTVVVFTSSPDFFPEVLKRFCYTIVIPPSDAEEREALLKKLSGDYIKLAKERGISLKPITVTPDLVSVSAGLTLHDVETTARRSFLTHMEFKHHVFVEAKKKLLKDYGLRFIEPPARQNGEDDMVYFSRFVGGLDYIKTFVLKRVKAPILDPERYRALGIGRPKGICMYGYQGTGKTHLARVSAGVLGMPFVELDPSVFLRSLVGESEQRVKQITEVIESLSPICVFVDEADSLMTSRALASPELDSGAHSGLTSGMLKWLSEPDRSSFVILATNFVERIDPAILRQGRIDKTVLFLVPDQEARKQILKVHCFNINPKKVSEKVDFDELAKKTFLWTGAELGTMANEAAVTAADRGSTQIEEEDFYSAMKYQRVNIDVRMGELKAMIDRYRSLNNYDPYVLEEARKSLENQVTQEDVQTKALIDALRI